jgi:replicative DNA helicase
MKVGGSSLFNAKALKCTDAPYIFIVEGEFDALSVIEVGGQCVALGSINNTSKFIQTVKDNPPAIPLILALDNDEAGVQGLKVLREELEKIKILFYEANISGEYNDPNDALINDREGFTERVKDPTQKAKRKEVYIKLNSVSGKLDVFIDKTNDTTNNKAIPTGFNILNDILDGGFYEGLYIIGAISGIGKTSICLQIADQIAQSGQDVIIFSLEMSTHTLIAKSLSRLTFVEDNEKDKKGFFYARTSRQIMSGTDQYYNDREKKLVQNALQVYRGFNNHLFFHEGIEGISADMILKCISEHISITGNRPVVIIDYLQILKPCELNLSDKQNIDKAVTDLKRMSMEYKLPVLAVSSFNRDNYLNPVNMTSFKESGAIEYSSDVLFGLQFKGMDELSQSESKKADSIKKVDEWRRADYRELELKILKNRNGMSGNNIYYTYYPKFNYFQETAI